jgi:membrane-bound ClpP family serine protease
MIIALLIILIVVGVVVLVIKMPMTAEVDGQVEAKNIDVSIGDKGVALSRLAPGGNIIINNKIWEAKSLGGFIDVDAQVEVIAVNTSEIVVKKV